VSDLDPYLLPGLGVLRNRLGIAHEAALDEIEREIVSQRIAEGAPHGDFDLAHLQAIHRHLFQDIYDWAGELRIVEISKDGHQFQFRRFIETGTAEVRRRLGASRFLRGLDLPAFAVGAGEIIGDVNYVHPFRDGNGRTQLQYLLQLAERADHPLDLTQLNPAAWLAASSAAHRGDYSPIAAEIARIAAR
jgi:cell filamentation protein